jgi:hypothetical protein
MNIGPILFIYRTTSDLNFIEIIMKVQLENLMPMEINNIICKIIRYSNETIEKYWCFSVS